MNSNFQISPNIKYTPLSFGTKQLIEKENEPPFRNRKFRVSPLGKSLFRPGLRVSRRSPFLRQFPLLSRAPRATRSFSSRHPLPPNRRMRRESLARVTLLLKTMKQTLYERGYGANYLAISRPSNKWASPPMLSLSLFRALLSPTHFLRLLFGPPSRSHLSFHRQTFVTLRRRGVRFYARRQSFLANLTVEGMLRLNKIEFSK